VVTGADEFLSRFVLFSSFEQAFGVNLPITSGIIRVKTIEEHAQFLTKVYMLMLAGTVWYFLGMSVYNREDILDAQEIA
jgi:hypothetical protein